MKRAQPCAGCCRYLVWNLVQTQSRVVGYGQETKKHIFHFLRSFEKGWYVQLMCTPTHAIKIRCSVWFDYRYSYGVLFMHWYPTLLKDPETEIQNLCTFPKLDRSTDFIAKVAEMTLFEAMKARTTKRDQNEIEAPMSGPVFVRKGNVKLSLKYMHVHVCCALTFITVIRFAGSIQDWKNYFTVKESEDFDAEYSEQMRNYPDLKERISFN